MTIAYTDDWLTIRQGDVRAELAAMPENSVHAVVTSPPYWGLRDYKTPPVVWGGEPEHDHSWGAEVPRDRAHHGLVRRVEPALVEAAAGDPAHGQFCECGAWLGDLGLEPTPELYVEHVVEVFRSVHRVLRRDGTVWLNLGDTYTPQSTHRSNGPRGGMNPRARAQRDAVPQAAYGKAKDLVGIPWRVAFALQADGWWLRSDVVWSKPNPMPESVTDRPAKSHEYLFLLAKSPRYYYDAIAVREPGTSGASDRRKMLEGKPRISPNLGPYAEHNRLGLVRGVGGGTDGADRNLRTVWNIATEPSPVPHYATFPKRLVEPCLLASTPEAGVCAGCGAPWVRKVQRDGGSSVAGPKSQAKRDDGLVTAFSGYDDGSVAPSYRTIGWRPGCRHGGQADDFEVLATPTGEGQGGDYHRARVTGTTRRGLDRDRRTDEGRRSMYRWEQRELARQLRASPNRYAMSQEAGTAWDHYVRTDHSGARAIPPQLLEAWIERGWLHWPAEDDDARITTPVPATVLDPFGGSGTTALVAERLGRRSILVELSEDYIALAVERVADGRRKGEGAALDMDLPVPDGSLWAAG